MGKILYLYQLGIKKVEETARHNMAFSFLKKSPPQVKWDKAPPEGIEAFKRFYNAETFEEVLSSFHEVCDAAKLERGGRYKEFFPYLKAAYQV